MGTAVNDRRGHEQKVKLTQLLGYFDGDQLMTVFNPYFSMLDISDFPILMIIDNNPFMTVFNSYFAQF